MLSEMAKFCEAKRTAHTVQSCIKSVEHLLAARKESMLNMAQGKLFNPLWLYCINLWLYC